MALTVTGCSSEPPAETPGDEESVSEASEESPPSEAEEDTDTGFPTDPVEFDGLGPCDLLNEEAAGRLGLPETGTATGEEGTMSVCDWEDLSAGNYVTVVLEVGGVGYAGFTALAETENLEVTEVGGYPAIESEEFGACAVQLALAPDAVASISGFQGGGSQTDCGYPWEVAEEIVATVA